MAIECGKLTPEQISGAILMLDQRKAYDRVDWGYLDRCMEHCGIGERYRSLVLSIYSGSTADIRFGTWTKVGVPICQGLRQGDPLSPLLYNIIAEPLLCYLRQHLAGLSLPGYQFRAIAFADDVALAVSSDDDVRVFRTAIDLHSRASNARLNDDKTEMFRIGRPSFDLPCTPMAPHATLRYLGIHFSESGLATAHMEEILVSKIKSTTINWRGRQLSLQGRILLANTVLLAKLWYAASINPFSDAFYSEVRKCLSEFIWNGRLPKTKWELVVTPKKMGGLGLLPLEQQSQAIFAQFIAKTLDQTAPPWWAATAHWALDRQLGTANWHSSLMLWAAPPSHLPSRLPHFWKRVLRVWRSVGGHMPSTADNISDEAILGLPLGHPLVTSSFEPSAAAWRNMRTHGLFTLGDVLERNPANGAAILRSAPHLRLFLMLHKAHRVEVQPETLSRLLDFPTEVNPRAAWEHAHMAGKPLAEYTPSSGRQTMHCAAVALPKLDKWAITDDPNITDEQRTKAATARWSTPTKLPLEPKQVSLLWLAAQAAVPTATRLSHFIPNLSPDCKFCSTAPDPIHSNDSHQHTARENIAHYFWHCPRVQDFWQRVSVFLQDTRHVRALPVFQVDLRMAAMGFGDWSQKIPNADALHGLAVWEIYRARTELSLNGTRLDGLAMFNRWKSAVVTRIAHDFYYAYSIIKAPCIFSKRWLSVSNRWFHFDPGEETLSGKLFFRSESQQVDGRLSHIIQPILQQAADDNTNVPDLSSISPDRAH